MKHCQTETYSLQRVLHNLTSEKDKHIFSKTDGLAQQSPNVHYRLTIHFAQASFKYAYSPWGECLAKAQYVLYQTPYQMHTYSVKCEACFL